jgi:hypothetical protein
VIAINGRKRMPDAVAVLLFGVALVIVIAVAHRDLIAIMWPR